MKGHFYSGYITEQLSLIRNTEDISDMFEVHNRLPQRKRRNSAVQYRHQHNYCVGEYRILVSSRLSLYHANARHCNSRLHCYILRKKLLLRCQLNTVAYASYMFSPAHSCRRDIEVSIHFTTRLIFLLSLSLPLHLVLIAISLTNMRQISRSEIK